MLNMIKALSLTSVGLVALLSTAPASTVALSSGSQHNIHRARSHASHADKIRRLAGKEQAKRDLSIVRRADGSVCKVRPSAASSSADAPAATTSSTEAPAATWSAAATTSSSEAAAAPAASSAAAVAVSNYAGTGGSTNSGDKLGLAWPNGDWASSSDPNYVGNYIGTKASWYYTWSPYNVGSADKVGLEYVPMLWGPKQEGEWWSQVAQWPSDTKHVLFFNEPNEPSQCNMAAADSVWHWKTYMEPLAAKGYKLGMAATTSAPDGLTWVLDFMKACPECTIDFVPLHYYDVDVTNFQNYVTNFHQQTGKPIWVTEYACQNFNNGPQCSAQQTTDFHQQMAAWFDQQSFVERYSPFGVMQNMQGVNQDNALMNPDGTITALGSWYISSS